MTVSVRLVLLARALGLLAAASFGQSVLYAFDSSSPDDLFGFSVSGAGDVNVVAQRTLFGWIPTS